MKTMKIAFMLALMMGVFTACTEENNEEAEQSWNDFKEYVATVGDRVENGAVETWDDIEKEYQEKKAELQAAWGDDVEDEQQEKLDELEADYMESKQEWQTWKAERDQEMQAATADFNAFIVEVENESKTDTERTWDDIQNEYNQLKARIDNGWDEMSTETQEQIEALQARWEEVKLEWEMHNDNK